jgi:hypothetical protein
MQVRSSLVLLTAAAYVKVKTIKTQRRNLPAGIELGLLEQQNTSPPNEFGELDRRKASLLGPPVLAIGLPVGKW